MRAGRDPAARRRRGGAAARSTSRPGERLGADPQRARPRARARAAASAFRRGERLPVGLRDTQPPQRQPRRRRVARRGERACSRAARGEGLRCEGVISTVVRLSLRGPRRRPSGCSRSPPRCATPAPQEVGFGDTTGMANPRQVREFFARRRRRRARPRRRVDRALPQHPRAGPCERAGRARGGRRELRVELRRARRVPGPAGRDRQHRHARTSSRCSRRWGSTTGIDLPALIACSRRAQELLGRPLASHTLIAGPVEWER